jgi:hypothetical protein
MPQRNSTARALLIRIDSFGSQNPNIIVNNFRTTLSPSEGGAVNNPGIILLPFGNSR